MRDTNDVQLLYIAIIACPILLIAILIVFASLCSNILNANKITNQLLHQLIVHYKANNVKNQEVLKSEIPVTPVSKTKICPQCNKENKPGNSFCMHCGQKLE